MINTAVFTKVFAFFALFMTVSVGAQQATEVVPKSSPVTSAHNVQADENGVAIDGYDPVAYFDEGQAVKGLDTHSCEYLNRTWHFSSAENRDKFLSDPEKFAPQYGGFCAHSLGRNKLVESDPQQFSIRDDKLYLYKNERAATKDVKKSAPKFDFNKSKRDKNWLTFQREF